MSFSRQEKKVLGLTSASVIVPQDLGVSLAEASQSDTAEFSLHDIKQRNSLFFDEQLTVYMVLRVPRCPEDELQSYLARLTLKLEVWTSNETTALERPSPAKDEAQELIFSGFVKREDDPIVLVSQDEDDDRIYLNLLWEIPVTLNRPRMRLQETRTTFIPIGLVSPLQIPESSQIYLQPFKAQDGNVFESLRELHGHTAEIPYLPISRLTSALPQPPKDDHTFHLRSTSSYPIPTHLGYIPKLRFSKPNVGSAVPWLIASLDVDIIPFVHVRGEIKSTDMLLQNGTVVSLTKDMLPIDCQSKDCVTLLFRLEMANTARDHAELGKAMRVESLAVSVTVGLELADGCRPIVHTHWTTNVDFGSSSDNVLNAAHPSTQRTNLANDNQVRQSLSMSLQPHSLLDETFNSTTISFAAIDSTVGVGVPFTWRVLIVNKSTKPAKLAIIPLPRVQKSSTQAQSYAKRHATRSSVASAPPSEGIPGEREQQNDTAQAVLDENIVYAMQHSGVIPPQTDLMSLTPELRIGPLGPGQCHEGEIRMIAFKSGVFTLDAIRVVDLVRESEQGFAGPGVVMDIQDLPDVIVQDCDNSR